jgi:hypothetical protein
MQTEGTAGVQTAHPEGSRGIGDLRLLSHAALNDLVDSWFLARAAAESLTAHELLSWSVAEGDLDGATVATRLEAIADETLAAARNRRFDRQEVLLRIDGVLVDVQFNPPGRIWVAVAAKTRAQATAAIDRVLELFPEKADEGSKPVVALTVWASGAEPTRRMREVEAWDAIADNYAAETRSQLAALMDPSFEAGKGGRLILLHGAPGTGKSTALATLAWQWKRFAELHYVIDPRAFLSEPEYLLTVTFGGRSDENWRVVLLEDSGGLFGVDAKRDTGEDLLGRLLNATDGLLGHSSKALYIITSNEPISSFHAAVSRPQRCAAAVNFLPLSEEEAKTWLTGRGKEDLAEEVQGERTLAELYALVQGNRVEVRPERHVGFRPVGR